MIAKKIKLIPQKMCSVAIIKKATNTDTAEADNPPILKLIFITSQSNERARDYISFASSKNYATHMGENEISTHEALSSHSCLHFVQVFQHTFTGDLFGLTPTCLVQDINLPN
ncbi:MAG: hypothetical protein ABIH72_05600, partial [archaeon]